jgi:hypothetical protein
MKNELQRNTKNLVKKDIVIIFVFMVPEFELRTLPLPGRHSTT